MGLHVTEKDASGLKMIPTEATYIPSPMVPRKGNHPLQIIDDRKSSGGPMRQDLLAQGGQVGDVGGGCWIYEIGRAHV